jgi:bifunctional UDP-N-acetylglucosamine pyrophosphorylase/glucosamine-1-phosphate N-acetyltransferase
MHSIVAVVLAAGKGTRMKSALPKAAHRLCGKPLARFAVDLTRSAGAERVIMVVGHGADAVQSAIGEDVEYVLQEPQLGTGHAVQQAAPLLRDFGGTVLVINGDVPLVPQETLAALIARHRETGAAATLLSAVLEDPASYGRIVRRPDGAVERIVERKDAAPEIAALREVNAGVYCFAAPDLFRAVFALDRNNQQGELYLTDVIEQLTAEGQRVEACVTEDPLVMQGVNDRAELAQAAAILRQRINRRWMLEGVTIIDPAVTYIDADVEIGPDTVIYPMTFLEGRTRVGAGCGLGPGARIVASTLGNGVTVQSSLVVEAEIGDETRIGPFANVRPGCRLGRGVKVGDFVELKNATVGARTSIAHLSYVGDAEVGERANLGASVVTVNYDGRRKHRTRIGDGAFVGCHATLIAPVEVGEGAYVAAASPVTEDVPPDALAIARSRQTNKEGWAARRRQGG